MYVDVDINHGHGVFVGAHRICEGGEEARKISVQYDADSDPFMKIYVERVTSK